MIVMNNIHEPTDAFSFDSLKLSKPVTAPGGSYFIRFTVNNAPLYIQPPKCRTKQGFLKTGKRYYTDLIFTNADDEFVRWMENLESTCHNHLFANREKWFEGDMELSEIENYFSSPMKIYKTGKCYIVRVNVQSNLGAPALTIYDEDNQVISIDAIDDKMDIITILEIKGIKCTATSFQIDIETKQVLTVKPVELFTKCVIKTHVSSAVTGSMSVNVGQSIDALPNVNKSLAPIIAPVNEILNNVDTNSTNSPPIKLDGPSPDLVKKQVDTVVNVEADMHNNLSVNGANTNVKDVIDTPDDELIVNTEVIVDEPSLELTEFNIDLDALAEEDSITIKKSNEVYYEMYREACRKAKHARDLALSSYLEAKRIKNTYMLDDLSDSDESDLEQESIIE
jgi:hypothetical protein